MNETMKNECITFTKNTPEVTNRSIFLRLQLAATRNRITLSSYRSKLYGSLEAGGKPSTWFPPEGLVEPTSPPKGTGIIFDEFQKRKIRKIVEISTIIEIIKISWVLDISLSSRK